MTAERRTTKRLGLFTITTESRPVDVEALVRGLGAAESGTIPAPGEPPAQRVRGRLDAMAQHVGTIRTAASGTYPDGVAEFADRTAVALTLVRLFLDAPRLEGMEVALAMEAAMDLVEEWSAVIANTDWQRAVRGPRDGGSAGGKRKAEKAKPKIEARWRKAAEHAKALRATGRSRAEILAALEKRFGVKRSTLARNPAIHAHLPRARRKPSP